jgi:hypothetical protein
MAIPEISPATGQLKMAKARFLFGLDRTPDDRLTWSPGASAKTPLQLAAKLEGFLSFMAHLIQHRAMPERRGDPPPDPTNREEAKQRVAAAFGRLNDVLNGLQAADLEQPVPVPWGTSSLRDIVWGVGGVIAYHQGQLNYCQLAYGDEDPNIPPGWGLSG